MSDHQAWLARHGLRPLFKARPLTPAELKQRRDAARGRGSGPMNAAAANKKKLEQEFSAMLDAKAKRHAAATREREEFEAAEAKRLRAEGKLGPRDDFKGDHRLMAEYKSRVNAEMRAGAEMLRRPAPKGGSGSPAERQRAGWAASRARREAIGEPDTFEGRTASMRLEERAAASRARQTADFDALMTHMGVTPWASGDARRPDVKRTKPLGRRQRDAAVSPS